MTSHHSPAFIAEMKRALDSEKTHLIAEIGQTKVCPEYGRNDEDNATEVADFAAASSTADALKKRLNEVEAALQRIIAHKYGLPERGEFIPKNRLRANPAATTLVT